MLSSWLQRSLLILMFILIPISVQAQNTVIWYLPHPDDETIGMADSIYQSVQAGNRNYFIYFTKGASSLVRHRIKGPDGQMYALSQEEFGKARVRETMAALEVLGVEAHQVIFFDYPDGAVPLSAAVETMKYFATLYPGSIHRTVSQHDHHEDHQTLAKALAMVSTIDGLEVNPEYFHVYIYRNPKLEKQAHKREVAFPEIKAEALAQFSHFDPEQGRFAIAYQSTPDLIQGSLASNYEYLEPPEKQAYHGKPSINIGVTLSNLELGVFVPLSKNVRVLALYDYHTANGLAELNTKLGDDIPLLQVNLGVGYHFSYQKPYLTTKVNMGSYFIKLRHIPKGETRIGLGISTLLLRNR